MTETSGNGVSFNERVEATRFAGSVEQRLDRLEGVSKEMHADLKYLRTTWDRASGVITALSFAGSLLGSIGTILGAMAAFGMFR